MAKVNARLYIFTVLMLLFVSCREKTMHNPFNKVNEENQTIDLTEIQENGEIIVFTLYGPTSYFKFHGEDYGYQYKLVEDFAEQMGVRVRVELMHNERELVDRFLQGDGDMIAYNLTIADSLYKRLIYCGESEITHFIDTLTVTHSHLFPDQEDSVEHHLAWAVRYDAPELAHNLNLYLAENESRFLEISTPKQHDDNDASLTGETRRYAPRIVPRQSVLNAEKGVLSQYDDLFRRHSSVCKWDWRLLAALCYHESGFDPQAVSSAGAMGLGQLMPSTARSYGVGQGLLFNPSDNLLAAVRVINDLSGHYSSIRNSDQRLNFVLAAYNAGKGHIDDARRLARKMGKNPNVWTNNVDSAVLWLMVDSMYKDPVVEHGYMRGTETFGYVTSIRNLWRYYRKVAR